MLSATSPEVVRFCEAFEENQNLAKHDIKVIAEDRTKYIAIDEVDPEATPPYDYAHISHRGGRFLIDRHTGYVYSIKGYGKRGYYLGNVETMTEQYREASRTYDPSSRIHVESGRAKIATTPRPRTGWSPEVIRGGLARRRHYGGSVSKRSAPSRYARVHSRLYRRSRG